MSYNNIIGKKYEAIVANFLTKKGYKILERNHRNKIGEIDLICKDGNYIVFVEVKYKSSAKFGRPIEMITEQKIRKVRLTANLYLKTKRLLESNIRFDAVEVLDNEIRHIENAF